MEQKQEDIELVCCKFISSRFNICDGRESGYCHSLEFDLDGRKYNVMCQELFWSCLDYYSDLVQKEGYVYELKIDRVRFGELLDESLKIHVLKLKKYSKSLSVFHNWLSTESTEFIDTKKVVADTKNFTQEAHNFLIDRQPFIYYLIYV